MEPRSRVQLADLHLKLIRLEQMAEKKRLDDVKKGGVSMLEVNVVKEYKDEHMYELTVTRVKVAHNIEKGGTVSVWTTRPQQDLNSEDDQKNTIPKPPSAVVTEVKLSASKKEINLKLVFLSKPRSWEEANTHPRTVFIHPVEDGYTNSQLTRAMTWLKNIDTSRASSADKHTVPVVRAMFKEHARDRESLEMDYTGGSSTPYFNSKLDRSQGRAVEMALRDRPLTVLHGPPGTGKTTTIVEVILQHVERGQRVLVCAPSNKAVDNLLEGLLKQMAKTPRCKLSRGGIIRIGHPARVDEKHRCFSPRAQIKELRRKLRSQNPTLLSRVTDEQLEDAARLRALVVMSTLTSAPKEDDSSYRTFDLLVIDECGQATEAACWLAIPLAKKVLLAGDPHQLPPTVLSQEAASRGLAVSLMERQMKLHGEGIVHMLDTQYRMHALIQEWSSKTLYDGKLKAAPLVASHQLTDLPGVRSTQWTKPTLTLMDTAGCRMTEAKGKTKSYQNEGEARLVLEHVRLLMDSGLQAEDIGVITPYKGQVSLIAGLLGAARLDQVDVKSVDGYQGAEKEAILISLVRSNPRRQLGFVDDVRRLNVAVTRARRHLFVVCDTVTVCQHHSVRSLVLHLAKSGTRLSALNGRRPPGGPSGDNKDNSDGAVREESASDITKLTATFGAMKLKHPEGHAVSRKSVTTPSRRSGVATKANGGHSAARPTQIFKTYGQFQNTAASTQANKGRQGQARTTVRRARTVTSHAQPVVSSYSWDYDDF
ncbi:DNA-binding protein SMUBP-2-like [Amphibalanus amphitrite]|uniref:DNA-binding protein SMUBP-2-like n=1 Tax=Amphibalanus amphitrite TaxID=1232801 RepID=UPI001C910791|nr:DNA-binding protein SMUBP-2-like [Amphibalanus amphitrite]